MTAEGVTDILPGNPFYVYILNLTAKPVNLSKLMIVADASSSPTCIIHAKDNEPHILTDEFLMPTKCDNWNYDPTINAVRYRPPKRYNMQLDHHNAVQQSEKNSKTDCRE